jgi:hypothetical protein
MWLNELGSLGSIGGVAAQYHAAQTAAGKVRIGGFYGFEPEILQAGYADGVRKAGAFVALDGEGGRNHTLGFVNLTNSGLKERSVLAVNNFLPAANKFFLYQSLEYDLTGPENTDVGGGLRYFLANGRYSPASGFDVHASFHHGRSIDTRSITDAQLDGRPVNPATLQGLLFESFDFRVTVKAVKDVSVFGGFGRDRNNRDETPVRRANYGFFTSGFLDTGIDLRFSAYYWIPEDTSAYHSWNFSIGRTLGAKVYVSADYSSSVSVLRLGNGIQIETRPESRQFEVSAITHWNRSMSFLIIAQRTNTDSYHETGLQAGIIYRL